MLQLSLKPDIKALESRLGDFVKRQVPFASARALTEVAKKVAASENARLPSVVDRPTPFTMRTFTALAATKASQTAIVYARPIQGAYLAPEEFGEPQKLGEGAKAELVPVDAALNQYGNIPRGAVRRWKGRPNIFIGNVKGVGGIWQRLRGDHLRLLVRFAMPVVPKVRLGFRDDAMRLVPQLFPAELSRQLVNAVKTAR